ncbi:OmpA family protein [Krasilnikoviella flava]|uniref:Outer membrane protein OmpA n=1 Tax=Krasilnikoviella flava TaxID=526729 RepID=A0A1T5LIV1_9MICO|nr:OmpA family protein [Krasilnikoviella flava]SKC75745.1 Outer membrane protein OmpA [Krasilnikoviella flava]
MRRPPLARRTAPLATVLTLALTTATLGSAASATSATSADSYDWPTIDSLDLGEPAQEQRVASVTAYVADGSVTRYVVEGSVDPVDDTTTDGGETVVTLSSDILFDSSDASLSKAAKAKIASLVEDAPEGAAVTIDGHTDTVDTDAFNQDLSERRAKAVAGAVGDARGDLKLDVHGYGETQLKEPETGDGEAVAHARAENRRVEIRYGS